jgi:tetratricopeptide (TPR) repeat protein
MRRCAVCQHVQSGAARFCIQILATLAQGRAYHALGDYPRAIVCMRKNMAVLAGNLRRERFGLLYLPAETAYQQAMALAEELGMRPLLAHCHRGLGMLYVGTGQQEQARAELSTALALYRAMEMSFWLPQTEVALAHIL